MKNILISMAVTFALLTAFSFNSSFENEGGLAGPQDLGSGTIGEVALFGGNFAPRGWALCEGQLLPISQYSALFSILGTTYGGDGRTTFALPDLRGRQAVHAGTGPGLSDIRLGQKGGAETVTLTSNQIPSHQHTTTLRSEKQNNLEPDANNLILVSEGRVVEDQIFTKDIPSTFTGGGQAHENRSPYLGLNYIICLEGTFPSRS